MNGAPHALESFIEGLHEAFWISVAITLIAALVSLPQPPKGPASRPPESEHKTAKML